jgi:hypothetical protein
VSPDGSSVFVTGTSEQATHQNDKVTIGYASNTGAELWSARADSDSGMAVAVTPDGATVVSAGATTAAYVATTGGQAWSAAEQTLFVVADPDGTQVVAAGPETVSAYTT